MEFSFKNTILNKAVHASEMCIQLLNIYLYFVYVATSNCYVAYYNLINRFINNIMLPTFLNKTLLYHVYNNYD